MALLGIPEFLAQPVPTDLWLVDEIVPSSGFTLVLAPPKTGKSIWTLQVTLSLALGQPFLGHHCPLGARRVAFLQGDAPLPAWHGQIQRYSAMTGVPPGWYTDMYPRGFLVAPEYATQRLALRSQLRDLGIEVIVFDALESLSAGVGTNEKEQADKILRALDHMADGRPHLVIHHPRKLGQGMEPESAQDAAAGHHSFSSAANGIVHLTKTAMTIITRHTEPVTIQCARRPKGHPEAGAWIPGKPKTPPAGKDYPGLGDLRL